MSRINVIFRKLSINNYSIVKLLALLDEKFSCGNIELKVWQNFEDIKDILTGKGINVFAYSFMTPLLEQVSIEIEQLLKLISHNDWLIAGGVHPTIDPFGCLKIGFDRVFCSESERTLISFFEKLLDGSEKKNDKQIVMDENENPISLDDYPPFPVNKKIFVPIELSRGCYNACTFCCSPRIYHSTIRFRSAEGLKQPFTEMKKNNRRKLFFVTSNILSYRINGDTEGYESLITLCEQAYSYNLTDIHLGSFPSEIRPEYLDEKFMEIFDKYCINRNIVIGAQSGSKRMLKILKRGHTVQDVKNAAIMCRKYKFVPMVDFIFGLPDETKEDREQTLDLIEWLLKNAGAKIHPHYFISFPGTPLWGIEPQYLDTKTLAYLEKLDKFGKSFGDIKSQEKLSRKIFSWKQKGKILV